MNEEDKVIAPEVNPIDELQAKLKKTEEERDNYKKVALVRKGKLPGDADFFSEENQAELSVAEQVRIALLDREAEQIKQQEKTEVTKLVRENSELKLALKNRPNSSMGGGGSGSSVEVKDGVFSQAQLDDLTKRAERLKTDPVKFIENAKKNLMRNR